MSSSAQGIYLEGFSHEDATHSEREVSEAYSLGLLATELVWKGDNSGVEVQYIGDSNPGERERMLSSILSFSRKDLIESPQLYIRYRF